MKRIHICYPAIFTFDRETNAYIAEIPDMKQIPHECKIRGNTFEEACKVAEEAVGLALERIVNDNYPAPSWPESFSLKPGSFIVPIWYDSLQYRKAVGNKSVNKMVTIPEWMNDLVKEEHLNCSKILQEAIKEKLGIEE